MVERNIPDRVLKVSSGKSLGFSMSVRSVLEYCFILGLTVSLFLFLTFCVALIGTERDRLTEREIETDRYKDRRTERDHQKKIGEHNHAVDIVKSRD